MVDLWMSELFSQIQTRPDDFFVSWGYFKGSYYLVLLKVLFIGKLITMLIVKYLYNQVMKWKYVHLQNFVNNLFKIALCQIFFETSNFNVWIQERFTLHLMSFFVCPQNWVGKAHEICIFLIRWLFIDVYFLVFLNINDNTTSFIWMFSFLFI